MWGCVGVCGGRGGDGRGRGRGLYLVGDDEIRDDVCDVEGDGEHVKAVVETRCGDGLEGASHIAPKPTSSSSFLCGIVC